MKTRLLALMVLGGMAPVGCDRSAAPPSRMANLRSDSVPSTAGKAESPQELHTGSQAKISYAKDPPTFPWYREVGRSGVEFSFSSGRSAGEFAILESLGGGVGILDYDRDGLPDLCFAGGGTLDAKQVRGKASGFYRNQGHWQFRDKSLPAGLATAAYYTHGVFPADFDGDGFDDVAITGYGAVQCFRNQGDGTFVTLEPLLTHPVHPWSTSLAWSDFDRDGVLDMYVAHYVDWSWDHHPECAGNGVPREVCAPREFEGVRDVIWMGDGTGGFIPRSKEVGLVDLGKGLGVTAADVDLDGDVDIYVANDTTDNYFYVNDGRGNFTESAVITGVAGDDRGVSTGSMGTLIFDANADGRPDIWVVNFERELYGLYRNDGQGLFTHVSRSVGLASIGSQYVGFGTMAVDHDHDGDPDLVVANGHVSYASPHAPYKQLPLLLENQQGRFRRVGISFGYFGEMHTGRGLAAGDLDRDGVLDLVVSHLEEPVSLLQGQIPSPKRAIRIQLVGTLSNRNALGAVVRLPGNRILMHNGGGSYLSTSENRLWITGLDQTDPIPVKVTWPSGKEVEYVLRNDGSEELLVEPASS
jgi:hypothetical protein